MSTLITDYVADFKAIRFSILGPDDIHRGSSCPVFNQKSAQKAFTVNDLRLGDDSFDRICLVCSKDSINCHGHFGEIPLQWPVINPIYVKSILRILRSICYSCGIHLGASHLELGAEPAKIVSDNSYCSSIACLEQQPKYSVIESELYVSTHFSLLRKEEQLPEEEEIVRAPVAAPIRQRGRGRPSTPSGLGYRLLTAKEILSLFLRIPSRTLEFLGIRSADTHPSRMIFQNFPVLPMVCRPPVNLYSGPCDDDLTYQFNEIVKNNEAMVRILRSSDTTEAASAATTVEILDGLRREGSAYALTDSFAEHRTVAHSFAPPTLDALVKILAPTPVISSSTIASDASTAIDSTVSAASAASTAAPTTPTTPTTPSYLPTNRILTTEEKAKLAKYDQNIDFRIKTLFNNARKKAKHTISGKVIKGIKELISGKTGIIRHNMLGKRCEQTARTVAGGDPYIHADELIVPPEIAAILTIPVRVTPYNRSQLFRTIKEGRATYHVKRKSLQAPGPKYKIKADFIRDDPNFTERSLQIGDVVERTLQDGDYVLLNRQPTLHRAGMIAQRILVRPGRTLRINLAVTKAFNCDFDGDEMNIHVPQSEATQAELRVLSTVHECFFSDQANRSNLCIVQDGLLGAYLMTRDNEELSEDDRARLTMAIDPPVDLNRVAKTQRRHASAGYSARTGRFFASLIFPSTLHYVSKTLEIRNGMIVRGYLSKETLGQSRSGLLSVLHRNYDVATALHFVDNIQFLAREWLTIRSFSFALSDCTMDPTVLAEARKIVEKYAESALHMERTVAPSLRETKVTALLNRARDASMRTVREHIPSTNNLLICVESGSKGDAFNIAQISNIVGQQYSRGKRLHHTRTLPCFPPSGTLTTQEEHETKGFVYSNFYEGLHPGEYFCHAITGREGVCDTATGTAISGYLQRKVIKLLENTQMQYDGTVRDADGRCYQLSYNYGIDPSRCPAPNRIQDLENLAQIMNAEFEELHAV